MRKLEQLAAQKVGKQAAVFMPSGTMANLCSLLTHTSRGTEVLLERTAHIISYDGVIASNGNRFGDGTWYWYDSFAYALDAAKVPGVGSGLFLFDNAVENVLDMSIGVQDGTQPPLEMIDSLGLDDAQNNLAVVLFSGANRLVRLQALNEGELRFTKGGAIFAIDELKAKKIAIFDDGTTGPRGGADEVEKKAKAMGATTYRYVIRSGDKDFRAVLGTIPKDVDIIVPVEAMGARLTEFARTMKPADEAAEGEPPAGQAADAAEVQRTIYPNIAPVQTS